jgi:hypothetical protein
MDWNLNRRKREREIAAEIADELHRVLGPTSPEVLAEKSDLVCGIFADSFDRHQVVSEASGERILAHVPLVLADLNRKFAELNRQLDAACVTAVAAGRRIPVE